jgi:glycosyltransferase involved in cell wall biosynthesis
MTSQLLRFSVVIPCYNQARFLPEAIASLIAQTDPRWEAIIVDDGSSDETAAVAEALIAAHPDRQIRLIRQANQGLEAARNAGIALAQAPYIQPLDADDALMPMMFAEAGAIFDRMPTVGFVYGDVQLIGSEQGRVANRPFDPQRMRVSCLLHTMSPFRRTAWTQVGGYRMPRGHGYEDWDFWLSLIEAGWQGYYLPITLAYYRRTSTGMLERVRRQDLELRALLIERHPRLYEPGFRQWAARVRSPQWSAGWPLRDRYWPLAFLWYCLLIARYAPRDLPSTALRPLYWRLPAHYQTGLRTLARRILR